MNMNATKLAVIEERIIGEDRMMRTDAGWYWQTRGCADAFGPFATVAQAAADCGLDGGDDMTDEEIETA